jgi:steroid 5-alpha reductase family enzyme
VKDYVGPAVFFVFNVVFISLYQSLLLFSITTPTYVLLLTQRLATHSAQTASWEWKDSLAAITMLCCVGIAFVADQQQWNYHSAKSAYQKNAKVPAGYDRADLDRGFLTKGLFAYSRHPNFAAEQGVWVTLYLWSCLATKTWYNWSGTGAALYLALFQGSTWLTELLSARKYPDYSVYQQKVAKFLPLLGSSPPTFPAQQPYRAAGSNFKDGDAVKAGQRHDLR